MATISVTLPSDGESIEAADVNTPINTIVNAINGNLDSDNIKDASITPQKLTNFGSLSWSGVGYTPNTVTYNGNRSYDLVFNSNDLTTFLSAGMRLRTTRTVAAPNQCTSLNGTSQYYSKSSPTGTSAWTAFTVSAWVKIAGYPQTTTSHHIVGRYNSTPNNGWVLQLRGTNGQGQIQIRYANGASESAITTYTVIPLNKWVHVTAVVSATSTQTGKIYFDGIEQPSTATQTAATSLAQGTDPLTIGAQSGTATNSYLNGKVAQVAIFSAALSQATIQSYCSQSLSGSETSLVSAYSFNNSINDLNTTNANNLTASGSAVATNADSPYGGQCDGTISTTLDYGIITKVAFSTNTTLSVRASDINTIPTSGGVSAISYSVQDSPYLFPNGFDQNFRLGTYLGSGSTAAISSTTQGGTEINGTNNARLTFTTPSYCSRVKVSVAFTTSGNGGNTNVFYIHSGSISTDLNQILQYNWDTSNGAIETSREIDVLPNTTYTFIMAASVTAGSVTFSGAKNDPYRFLIQAIG